MVVRRHPDGPMHYFVGDADIFWFPMSTIKQPYAPGHFTFLNWSQTPPKFRDDYATIKPPGTSLGPFSNHWRSYASNNQRGLLWSTFGRGNLHQMEPLAWLRTRFAGPRWCPQLVHFVCHLPRIIATNYGPMSRLMSHLPPKQEMIRLL